MFDKISVNVKTQLPLLEGNERKKKTEYFLWKKIFFEEFYVHVVDYVTIEEYNVQIVKVSRLMSVSL